MTCASARLAVVLVFLSALVAIGGCNPPPAAPDAAVADAGRDAPMACENDAQCDDGLFCNGVESCGSGTCVAGAPMACDDGIACTRDLCAEELRRCVAQVPDDDRDGSGAATCLDASGTPLGDDCADDDANRFPGNTEVCDALAHDEDCDDTTLGPVDSDGDGQVDARCCNGATCGTDCNDGARSANPDATEVCNEIDDDCDTRIDEEVAIDGFEDHDHDGYGDAAHPLTACGGGVGFSVYGTDCDDADPAKNPGQAEFCDLEDNDCDTTVDESPIAVVWYRDVDGDGFGSAPSGTTTACAPPVGYSILSTDCNDATSSVSPGAAEVCNAIDDDCSGSADYAISAGDLEDDDGDGLADAACGAPRGVDCDDRDALTGGGALETCDGRDNDCDGRTDEDATTLTFYRDLDGDGFGASASGATLGCGAPLGFVRRGGDCDDGNASRRPYGTEGCNASDDDCDGAIDEGSAAAMCATDPHALSTCIIGTCVVVTCETGFESCDLLAPACETDLLRDAANCGGCHHACDPGEYCNAGTCGPTLVGSFQSQGMDPDRVYAVTTDPSGDYYFAGVLGAEAFIGGRFIGGDYAGDIVVARVTRGGALVWLQTFGGSGQLDEARAIVLGPSALWIAGLTRSASISFGAETFTPGDTRFHAFVARLDPATGNALAGTTLIATSVDARFDGLTLAGGRIVVAGGMSGSATLPVLGAVTTAGGFDALAIGLDEASGAPVWSSLSGSSSPDAWIATTTTGGRVALAGQSLGAFSFGGTTITSRGGYDIVIGDLDPATGMAGSLRSVGGSANDFPLSMVASGTTVVIAGQTLSTDGPWGPMVGAGDGIVFQQDSSTGSILHTWLFGSTAADSVNGIAIDAVGNLYVAGVLGGPIVFDGATIGPGGGAFLASFDPFFVPRFAVTETVGTADGARAVAVASDGHMFIGGSNTAGFATGHVWVSHYAP